MIRLEKEAAIVTAINVINFKIDGMDTMDSMNSKVIVLWGDDDSLLLKAVETLLNTGEGLMVIRFSDRLSDDDLIQNVKEAHPDIFILHEELFIGKSHLLTKFLQDFPKLKIITLNLDNNQVEIYSKQAQTIQKSSDLLSIILYDVDSEFNGGETIQ